MAPVGEHSIGREVGTQVGGAGRRAARSRVSPAEILGDGTMAGGIGASAIALFFLVIDTARREALFTPSVMASALLRGVPPASFVCLA